MNFRFSSTSFWIFLRLTTHDHSPASLQKAKKKSRGVPCSDLDDVISELPDGTQTTLPNGFNVLPGTSVGLGVKLEGPEVTRLNGASPISVTYANGGNTDVSICELLIVVEGGNIATSIEGLKEEMHELHLVPDTGVDNRGYATISPGTQRTINLFLQQTSSWTHVYLYVVK